MNPQALELLEFGRVTAWIAEAAASAPARDGLRAWPPHWNASWRTAENARLAEAIGRETEPGPWCVVPEGALAPLLDPDRSDPLDGPALREVLAWLEGGAGTRDAWRDETARERHPALAGIADEIPQLDDLEQRIARSIEPDGRVSDAASPALARARRELAGGERDLERRLEKWAQGFGENAYVTRHGDRFVALVPAAGFPRRRGIVHDVSNSGQSLFVEPLEACESNNHLLELRAVVIAEERRVLRELAGAVLASRDALEALERALVHFDSLRARARWAREQQAIAIEPAGDALRLLNARHPLLARARRGEVVPLDLALTTRRMLLVSGPNMGGKTILLKSVGLCAALAHAALPVPAAEGSALPELDSIEADLGDHQSVDAGLSTFAAHLATLRTMAEVAGPRSLLLADELGAGTDPDEGTALGRALLEHFAARGAWGVLTTHYGGLKRAAGEIPGVASGSLDFDAVSLTSRFRFIPDIPGASHALSVAERLGFPAEVLARARALAPESARAIERLLAELHERRAELDAERDRLAAAVRAAEAAEVRAKDAAEEARRTLGAAREKLTRESEALLAQSRELWQTVQREARRAERSRESADALRTRIESTESQAARVRSDAAEAYAAMGGEPAPRPIERVELGQKVKVADLGVEAEVASLPDAEGRVQLRRGSWNIQSHVSRLIAPAAAAAGAAPRPARAPAANWESPDEAAGVEVDVRGNEVDEALSALDRALDRAVLAGLGEIRVVHGIGRGVLRAAVERHLRGHPQVASQRMGLVGEGGRGVTVARLR